MTRRYIVVGAVAFGVVLVFFLFILKPKFSQISKVRSQVVAEQATTQSLNIRLRQLQESQRNQVQTVALLASLNRALPPTPDLPSLIRLLQDAATKSGVDLLSIAPSPPTELANATGVDSVSVNLQVKGGFFRQETFLTRLEDLQRVLEITSISLTPEIDPATGLTDLSATYTFRMYVVQEKARVSGGAPRPAATPAAGASPGPAGTSTPSPAPSGTR